jgi:caa(3)-type oxidase subunit IV
MSEEHGTHATHEHPATSVFTFFKVYIALLLLLLATIWVQYQNFGGLANPIAMAIAVIKMGLVMAIFMGVRFGSKLMKLWAFVGFFFLLILFGTLIDYSSREWMYFHGWSQ